VCTTRRHLARRPALEHNPAKCRPLVAIQPPVALLAAIHTAPSMHLSALLALFASILGTALYIQPFCRILTALLLCPPNQSTRRPKFLAARRNPPLMARGPDASHCAVRLSISRCIQERLFCAALCIIRLSEAVCRLHYTRPPDHQPHACLAAVVGTPLARCAAVGATRGPRANLDFC
jgi:hypothetical protein